MKKILFLFVFCFGVCQTNPQNHIDGIVAIVNNSMVLKSDVLEQSVMVAKQKNINPQKTPLAFEKIFILFFDDILTKSTALLTTSTILIFILSLPE